MNETHVFSLIIPARDEMHSLDRLLSVIRRQFAGIEIIVVNDGSVDDTGKICAKHGVTEIRHPYGMGNGAAIKTGARAARHDVLVFMDADGQHDPLDIPRLLALLDRGYDMAVGARDSASQASLGRSWANKFYNRLASWMTGHRVDDLTSGFRAARAAKFREFLHLLPNRFSYPTTSTMAFFRAGYAVAYERITARRRLGERESHIRPVQDGVRFLLIIFKIGTLYSPLKLFFPVSAAFFLTGLGYYLYTYFTAGRFTNMSALMFTTAVLVFLMGLVSEQITQLIYQPNRGTAEPSASEAGTQLAMAKAPIHRTGT